MVWRDADAQRVRLDFELRALHGAGLRLLLLASSFFLLTLYAFAYDGVLRRVMECRPLRYLGNMSYSYYLLHGVTLTGVALVLTHAVPPAPGRTLAFVASLPLGLAATMVTSTVLFLLVEKPLSLTPHARRRRRAADARVPVVAAAIEPTTD